MLRAALWLGLALAGAGYLLESGWSGHTCYIGGKLKTPDPRHPFFLNGGKHGGCFVSASEHTFQTALVLLMIVGIVTAAVAAYFLTRDPKASSTT
jgi:hypothetical protein